ncbi:MAG TPA: response regulator [Methylomirabilota bacterium]|jgi:diguanylate cyclase (GGDEF)-like protein|nr:response regulator [Methylomirabilota bacterium]
MTARVLVVEDDEATRGALRALLDDAGYVCDDVSDGERAVAAMRDAPFDLVLLDLGLPGMSGAEVHRHLRQDPRTRFLPIVFLTADTDRQVKLAELEAGAEDFITKPYDAEELLARVGAAVRRWSGLRAVNPLSGLPGNPTITEEIDARLARNEDFALLYVDIDRFKEFNDHYGFTRGDRVITMLAEILTHVAGADERFVGHIGGDDFVVLARTDEAEAIAEKITRGFDEAIRSQYDPADRARGWIEAHDRGGRLRHFPFATVSIGIVNIPPGRFDGATAAARAAAEVKEVAKRRVGSAWAVDRRKS